MAKLAVNIEDAFFGAQDYFLKNLGGVGKLTSLLLTNAIVIAGIILLFMLIFGGFSMISAAGSGNPQQYARAREIIAASIIGFIIVIIAYWVVKLVSTTLGLNLLS